MPSSRTISANGLDFFVVEEGQVVDGDEPDVVAAFDPEGVMFWNVNTPDEYERACARAAMA